MSQNGARLACQLRLPLFEGPLDVLLVLIERQELEITAISLAQVTDQFLSHVAALPTTNPAALADFVELGARLVFIKSRALLPRATDDHRSIDHVEVDDAAALAEQLVAYRLARATAVELSARLARGFMTYARPARQSIPVAPTALASVSIDELAQAVRRRLLSLSPEPVATALTPMISLAMKVDQIARLLAGADRVQLIDLLALAASRVEVIVTFMALLELIRRRRINIEQKDLFGNMLITSRMEKG